MHQPSSDLISEPRLAPEWFRQVAAQCTHSTALVFGGSRLSYGELDHLSDRLANHLATRGVGPETLVGIHLERSLEMVVSLLAIWKAGAAYLPLDPRHPRERLGFILKDATVSLVISRSDLEDGLPRGRPPTLLADVEKSVWAENSSAPPVLTIAPANLAYVIYTSGSTGRPKGVELHHRGLSQLIAAQALVFGVGPASRILQFSPLTFDASLFEIVMALMRGATLCLARQEELMPGPGLLALLGRERISHLTIPPSALAALPEGELPHLRALACAGEACPRSLVERFSPGRRFFNLYGPTESTVWSTGCQLDGSREPNLGTAIDGLAVRVMNRRLDPVANGEDGELCIAGNGLARGYLSRPALTAERFVPDPEARVGGERLYRSGDRVCQEAGGDLVFLGRIDRQAKIRGQRIELGEIEAVLRQHPEVADCAVLVQPESPGGPRLVAWWVSENPTRPPAATTLRSFLKEQVSDAMVPAIFVALESFPLTAHGKVDHGALPMPETGHLQEDAEFEAPRNATEREVARLYEELLGISPVGRGDHFFELGGHSLLVTKLASGLAGRLGVVVPLEPLFADLTVAELAATVERLAQSPEDIEPPRAVPREGVLPPSSSQERVWFVQTLYPEMVAYHASALVHFRGALTHMVLVAALEELVRRHEVLRTTWPERHGGPVQEIHPPFAVELPLIDLSALSAVARERALERLTLETMRLRFDMTQLPLLRWRLFRLSEEDHRLLQVEHHLIHDGWSFNVMLGEILHLYRAFEHGEPSPLPEPALQFADFALWQRRFTHSAAARRQLDFWRRTLRDAPALELALDHPRPPFQTFDGRTLRTRLDAECADRLRALARQNDASIFMLLLAAFFTLLYRYTGQSDLSIGSGIANRRFPAVESLLGMIINNVVFRGDVEDGAGGAPTFLEWLEQVRQITLLVYGNQDVPFDRVVEAVAPERDIRLNPLFQVIFGFHDAPLEDVELEGLEVDVEPALSNHTAKFDLSLVSILPREQFQGQKRAEGAGAIDMNWEYNTRLFDGTTIERLHRAYRSLLDGLLSQAARRLDELPLISAAERHQMVLEGNSQRRRSTKRVRELLAVLGDEPLPDLRFYVADSRLQPLPMGAVGPLWIAGEDADRGIPSALGARPASVVPDLFSAGDGWIFPSGERARFRGDGRIDLVARDDAQGRDLARMEAALARHGDVRRCAIVEREGLGPGAGKSLVAYVEAWPETPEPAPTDGPVVSDGAGSDERPQGPAERQQPPFEWNAASSAPSVVDDVTTAFLAQEEQSCNRVAVTCDGRSWTFRQLAAASRGLSRELVRRGGGAERRIGVLLPRSPEMALAVLAILEAGSAFVPLDPAWPAARLSFVLNDARMIGVLTDGHGAERVKALQGVETEVWCLDESAAMGLVWRTAREKPEDALGTSVPDPVWHPDQLAYLIYTSGSTGQPKGVMVPRRGLSNYLAYAARAYGVAAGQGAPLASPLTFDLSITALLAPLVAGRRVEMVAEEPAVDALAERLTADAGWSFAKLTPAHLEALAGRSTLGAGATACLVIGGEALYGQALQSWRRRDPDLRLVNEYGPTETVVGCCAHELPAGLPEAGPVPIGTPIAGARLYLLDEFLEPTPAGEAGELFVAGPGVTRGYLNHPARSAAVFMPCPFPEKPGERMYRTGDRARLLPTGEFLYLGRVDDQLKVRGHRVEPGEIEAVLATHPGVDEAVVGGRGKRQERRLVAWWVGGAEDAGLRTFLLERLPGHMVPDRFVGLDTWPLTAHGKVNRRALPEPIPSLSASALRAHLRGELGGVELPALFVEVEALPRRGDGTLDRQALPTPHHTASDAREQQRPGSPMEDLVARAWAEVLERNDFGVDEDFFALGGHSLLGTRILSRLRESLGVDLPLRLLFEAPTVASLARRLEERSPTASLPPILPLRGGEAVGAPLSFAQQRLWFLDRLLPGHTFYNLTRVWGLKGELHVAALCAALAEIERRHAVLRSAFTLHQGQGVQSARPPGEPECPVVDLRALPSARRDGAREAVLRHIAATPFDLAHGPLWRALVVQMGGAVERHSLALVQHHITTDGWSQWLLLQELAALYPAAITGQPSPLEEPALQYADYAAWQRRHQGAENHAASLEFWHRELAGAPTLQLPTDFPRPEVQVFRGQRMPFRLPGRQVEALEALGREHRASLFMTLLAAFQVVLARWSGQRDFVIGTPVASREPSQLEELIGLFINNVPMRARTHGDPPFGELLRRTSRGALAAFAHRDLPFERLVEHLEPERDLSRTPIFQVMFALLDLPATDLQLGDLQCRPEPFDPGTIHFDLELHFTREGEVLDGLLGFDRGLFESTTAERLLGHVKTLVAGVLAEPESRLSHLPLLTFEERQQLFAWNGASVPLSPRPWVHHQITHKATCDPAAIALVFRHRALRFDQLERRANLLAHHLHRQGVGPEDLVAVSMERSPEMVVAILAILKAGAAYVPLDPRYPTARRQQVLKDSGAVLVLRDREGDDAERAIVLPELVVSTGWGREREEDPLAAAPPSVVLEPDHLAYVLYTSGSTGRPKGVMVSHENVASFFTGMDEALGTEAGTLLATTSISFDISVLELLYTLSRGFQVVLQGDDVADYYATAEGGGAERDLSFSLFFFAAEETGDSQRYRLLLEASRFADEHGFEAVWTPERHFHSFGGLYPNPSVTSAAIATITERIQIRAGSVVLPLHNPIRVAEEWSMVDNLSNGRVGLSVASGWHANDFALMPENFENRAQVMFDGLETVRQLWRGEAVRVKNGTGADFDATLHPAPVQKELPVWVTAAGNPKTFEEAGRRGAHLLTHLLNQNLQELDEKIKLYRRAWAEAGHRGKGRVSLMLHTFLGEDRDAVLETVHDPFRNYLRTGVGLLRSIAQEKGLDMASDKFTGHDLEVVLEAAFHRYSQTSALFGTVEDCLSLVQKLKAIEVDEIGCLIDFGIDTDQVLESLELLNELQQRCRVKRRPEAEDDFSISGQIWRHGVTHLQATPSLAGLLVRDPRAREALRGLSTLLLGGEVLPADLAAEFAADPGRLINLYGPTETTVWSSFHTVAAGDGPVPIGRPIANTEIHLLDLDFAPVPVGVVGELCIGGPGVTRGYLGRPALCAERFVPHPMAQTPGQRLYRTGDLARRRGDGVLEILGRIDSQVKIAGHRIEPGEIEAHLRAHQHIADAAVVARSDDGPAQLVAYVVPQTFQEHALPQAVSEAEAKILCAQRDRFRLPNGLGVAYLSDLQARVGYREIFEDRVYLQHGLDLEDGDTIFDVGANIGFFSLFAHRMCRPGRVFCFEPIPTTFETLAINARLYGLEAELFQGGVAQEAGEATFTFYRRMPGLSGRYADLEADREATRAIFQDRLGGETGLNDEALDELFASEEFVCQLFTLSDLIDQHGVMTIDYLKIDVEKAEIDVLRGIRDEHWPRIKQIGMEVDTREHLDIIRDMLTARGFSVGVDETLVLTAREERPAVEVYHLYARRHDDIAWLSERRARPQEKRRETVAATSRLSGADLRQYLRQRLPDSMVPAAFVTLDALPLTPNQKLDRRALPAPAKARLERRSEMPFVAPKNAIEKEVEEVWREVLKLDAIGVNDNFFEVGGTSLLLSELHARLEETFPRRKLPLVEFFRYPTIAALAGVLGSDEPGAGGGGAPRADLAGARDRGSRQGRVPERSAAIERQRRFAAARRQKRSPQP